MAAADKQRKTIDEPPDGSLRHDRIDESDADEAGRMNEIQVLSQFLLSFAPP